MLDLILIAGLWLSSCVQTQTSQHQGWVQESYAFSEASDFEYSRQWHRDPECRRPFLEERESGHIIVGDKVRGPFGPGAGLEADFKSSEGTDLGAIELKEGQLRIARGLKGSGMRNTMLSLFGFRKVN